MPSEQGERRWQWKVDGPDFGLSAVGHFDEEPADGEVLAPASEVTRLEEVLREIKYRSGIAHATLRDAVYRIKDKDERDKAETALKRIGEINDLARNAPTRSGPANSAEMRLTR